MSQIIYEDAEIRIAVPEKAAVKGHVEIASKLEGMDEQKFSKLFQAANYAASGLFQLLNAQATNVILNEGENVKIDVLTRSEGDNLSFQWNPKELPEAEMKEISKKIKDEIDIAQHHEQLPKPEPPKKPEIPEKKPRSAENDYLSGSMDRIP